MSDSTGWGILGCGRMTDRRVAPAFRDCPTSRLVAFCSRDADKANAYREKHGAGRAYASLDEFLADDAIDVVYVATPPVHHVEHVTRCLSAGKHVLVDKPMATTGADARKLVAVANASDRQLAVLHQQRFHPAIERLDAHHADGTLGRIHVIRIQIAMWLRLAGNWRYDPAVAGGGAAMDLAPHALDLMLYLLGCPTRVTARMATHCLDASVEDFCAATLEFPSGAMGLLDLSFSAHAYGGRIEVFGDRGSYISDGCMQQADTYSILLRTAAGQQEVQSHRYDGACFRDAIENLSMSVRSDLPPRVTAQHAANVIGVIDAIYEAARLDRDLAVAPDADARTEP